jgi:outer membrane protein assembly factor BamA
VKVNSKGASKSEVKEMATILPEKTRPIPNNQLLGFPYKVGFYNFIGKPKKERGFRASLRNRWGEKPVLVDESIIKQNEKILENYLEDEGFFHSKVVGKLSIKKKEAIANYEILLTQRYFINSVSFKFDSTDFSGNFLETEANSLLKAGNPYSFATIKAERERIDLELRQKGFYYFSPNYIIIKADTNLGNHRINLYVELKPNIPQKAQKQYVINDVFVFSNFNPNVSIGDTVDAEADFFRGIILADSTKRYQQKIFTDAIGFRPATPYNATLQDVSLSRLINLRNFKFVKNRFEVVNRLDSTLLNVYYYLTPQKQHSFRADPKASSRSSGFGGTEMSISYINRNIFRAAELLTLSARIGQELQWGNTVDSSRNARNTRMGFDVSLSVPRFWMPFIKINPENSRTLPQTTVSFGYESINNRYFDTESKTFQRLYRLESYKTSINYSWRKGLSKEHTLSPLSINLVKVDPTAELVIRIFEDPRLLQILDEQFIIGGNYGFNYTPLRKPNSRNTYVLTSNLDLAGNLIGALSKLQKDTEKHGQLFGRYFSQYAKIDADFRFYHDINPKTRWANRLFTGVGIPYNNSYSLPFTRRYFAGGDNGIRAFRARDLGPGSYKSVDVLSEQFLGTQTGDIKLEANTEIRYKLTNFIGLAAFVDAGNVWLYKNNGSEENLNFTKNFYKQIAVGAGIGFRFDFSFIILRLDIATPLRKPWLEEDNRWVIKDISLGYKEWRKENLIWNIGIGYPF